MAGKGNPQNLTNAGKGRAKGSMNKTTRLAKDAIAEAFERLGGADRLVEWAQEDPDNEKVFYTALLPKLIPVQTEVSGPNGEAIKFEQRVRDDADVVARAITSLADRGGAASVAGQSDNPATGKSPV